MRKLITLLSVILAGSGFALTERNNMLFTADVDIEHGQTIVIEEKLTIDSGATLQIDGTLDQNGSMDIDGAVQIDNTLTIGTDGTSYDVRFNSDTAGDYMLWDQSEEALTIIGTDSQDALNVDDGNVDIADNIDVDGVSNLDNTDIDGTLNVDGGLTDIGTGTYSLANGDNDLGVAGDLEVNGAIEADGGVTIAGTLTTATESRSTANVATPTTAKATSVEYFGQVKVVEATFTLTGANDLDLPDGDHGTGVEFLTFPEGRIYILSAAINATVTNSANFNASDDDHYYLAIGTAVGADDNDLTATEADIIAKTTVDTAAGVTLVYEWEADMTAGADSVYDGTASAIKLYANAAIEATDNSDANTVAIVGTIRIAYILLGDD